ncbi:MAG TPA: hypothetical protein GX509_02775 [Firmicutes bacterium]|nr:hypothetical protein [Bacillota bacterium]HHY97645.1 hypothetical protein [Bacillota bacterium]
MRCDKVERNIHSYIAFKKGRIPREELIFDIAAFESHMGLCDRCQARLVEWERFESIFEELPELDMPEDLASAIFQAAGSQEEKKSNTLPCWGYALQRLRHMAPASGIDLAFLGAALGVFLVFIWSTLGAGELLPHSVSIEIVRSDAAKMTAALLSRSDSVAEIGVLLPRLFSEGAGLIMSLLRFGGV